MASLLLAFLILQFVQTNCNVDGGSIELGTSLVADAQSTTNPWYSQSKMFAFGFHPQGSSYVVAIWLVNSGETTVVWTAYPDDPPVSPNTTLKLTHQGELVVSSKQGLDNKIIASNVSSAVMKDNGNFVMYNDQMGVVWQSFDYPTDSMLLGQSLFGGQQLVSSVSKTNYSSGRFRIKMQIDGNLVMYPKNTEDDYASAYWSSGTFEHKTSRNYLYLNDTGLMLINGSNSDTIKYFYTTLNYPVIYRATLGDDGIFRLYFYNDSNSSPIIVWKKTDCPCTVKNICGLNSYCTLNHDQPDCVCLPGSDFVDLDFKHWGCERNFTKAMCKSGKENDTYYHMVSEEGLLCEDYPYYRAITHFKEECRDSCLKDCDCDAAFFKNSFCERYKFPLRYVKRVYDEPTTYLSFFKTIRVNLKATSVDKEMMTSSSKKTWLLVLVISLVFSMYSCISLSFTGYFVFKFRLFKYGRLLERRSLGLAEDLILQSYSYKELKKATHGFKQELGRGSFGRVYKGSFDKASRVIAVKRLEKMVEEGEKEFRAEMQVIGKTHHRNLVRLLGYCAEGKERLLVYEYMSNGTLADRLFRSETLPNWSERVQIALDVARGILYLHEECKTPIIHCDIKPQNILMDDFWTAKISDFGLAKLLMPDQTKTFTMVRGTRGYLAPEWQKNTPISVKVDIFSYGIVLLETICCRKNLEVQVSNMEEIVLSTWAYKCFERGQLDLLVGDEQVDMATLERLVKVGLWCIHDEPAFRPSMKSVVLMLEGITEIATPPCPISV
ncbi:G-type lectin S-receptor-like serine/threonine-protein kinase LECRK3 [Lactuca sativa]|uniref:G-type lectin S-receptor-like serine/threonine-protein kinase LECRK3 n=1 Tax=Lactuca sativa TaxID=4236 RepID=UPI000CD97D3E|nr:G-type lectin S-receptor-like serine/threonine-protein kinase LECRK3 [Lactuca sativa]